MNRRACFRGAALAAVLGLAVAGTGCLVANNGGDTPGPSFAAGTGGGGGGRGGVHGGGADGGSAGAGGGGGGGGGATGAGGSGGSGGGTSCTRGAGNDFHVAWTIEDANGAPSTCAAAGAATMDLDVLDLGTNADFHATFACADAVGSTCALPTGTYSFAMRLRDSSGNQLLEVVFPETFTVAGGRTNELATVPFEVVPSGGTPIQYIAFTWTIDRLSTGAPLTCAAAGAATVELDVGQQHFSYPCGDGNGVSPSLAAGSYPVTLKLLNAQAGPLSVTNTANVDVVIDRAVDLNTVIFDVQ